MRSSPPLYLRFIARALRLGFGQDASVPEHRVFSKELRKPSLAVLLIRRDVLKSLSKQEIYLSFLYVCMVNTIYLLRFVETPRKFIIAIINLRGVSTKLNKYIRNLFVNLHRVVLLN